MIKSIELKAGGWILLVGPRSMNPTMLAATARLGERGSLRILDGGNRFNAYVVARVAHGRSEVLNRITVSRAFTCYQVLSLLESTPALQIPFIILDLLNTFYDESVPAGERKRLLRACISHLNRLVVPSAAPVTEVDDRVFKPPRRATAGAVSVHPPSVPSVVSLELLELLQASATDTYFIQADAPAREPARLF